MDLSPFGKPSLLTRIAVGKAIGFVIGIVGFSVAPFISEEISMMTRLGILCWYPTIGAFIAVFGVFNWHPILNLPLPWWFRSTFVGAWMNFVLAFFAHEQMSTILDGIFHQNVSPFWFVLNGGVFGLVTGFLCTQAGGEGPDTLAPVVNG